MLAIENGTGQRGRPRDPATGRAIIAAAREVLAVRGFAGMSMAEIAKRAGVGKDSVYRRFSSKESLVRGLMTELANEHVEAPVSDDPTADLFGFIRNVVEFVTGTEFGAIIAGLVGASARNVGLADGFQEFWRERRAIAGSMVARILGPGADAEAIDYALDQILGPIYYRILLTGEPVTDDYISRLIEQISCTKQASHSMLPTRGSQS